MPLPSLPLPKGSPVYPFSAILADHARAFGLRDVAARLASLPQWERRFWWVTLPGAAILAGAAIDAEDAARGGL